ncbi:hypothetical protein AgCh_024650 [Apium graveolens]
MEIYTPVYEHMKVDIRMNLKGRKVELKTRSDTPDISNLQKSADFVHAFMLGFDVIDAVALLRLDELYVESFEIKDVKTLRVVSIAGEFSTRCNCQVQKTKAHFSESSQQTLNMMQQEQDLQGHVAGSNDKIDKLQEVIERLFTSMEVDIEGMLRSLEPRPQEKALKLARYYEQSLALPPKRICRALAKVVKANPLCPEPEVSLLKLLLSSNSKSSTMVPYKSADILTSKPRPLKYSQREERRHKGRTWRCDGRCT